jgi:hypothetical protein
MDPMEFSHRLFPWASPHPDEFRVIQHFLDMLSMLLSSPDPVFPVT